MRLRAFALRSKPSRCSGLRIFAGRYVTCGSGAASEKRGGKRKKKKEDEAIFVGQGMSLVPKNFYC